MDSAGPNPYSSSWNGFKPPTGTPINWLHPLANGLVGCWVLNEGGGLPIDQVTRAPTVAVNTAQKWIPSYDGYGWGFTSGQGWLHTGKALNNIAFNQGTIVQKLKQNSNPSGSAAAGTGWWGVNTVTTAFPSLTLKYQSGTDPGFLAGWIGPTGTDYRITATGVATSAQPIIYFFNWDTNVGSNFYHVNMQIDFTFTRGQVVSGGTNATPPVVSNINAGFGINGIVSSTGAVQYNNPNGNPMMFLYVYNRVLSMTEMQILSNDNYCFFQPVRKLWTRTPDIVRSGIMLGV